MPSPRPAEERTERDAAPRSRCESGETKLVRARAATSICPVYQVHTIANSARNVNEEKRKENDVSRKKGVRRRLSNNRLGDGFREKREGELLAKYAVFYFRAILKFSPALHVRVPYVDTSTYTCLYVCMHTVVLAS